MLPDPVSPVLDEVILVLQPDAGATADPPVLELTAADLMSDGGCEIVDLTNILGQGGEPGQDPTGTLTEFVSVDSGGASPASPADTTEPGSHSVVTSILYTGLSLSGDDFTSN